MKNLYELWENISKEFKDDENISVSYFRPASSISLVNRSLNTVNLSFTDDLVIKSATYKENRYDKENGMSVKDALNMPDDMKNALKKACDVIEKLRVCELDKEEELDEIERD